MTEADPRPVRGETARLAAVKPLRVLRRMVREPLLHFFIVGAVVFLAAQAWRASRDQYRIVVTDETVAQVAGKFRLQFGHNPDKADLERLIDAYLEEEILYREGLALGLDRNDEIVRRRVAQKVAFLSQDLEIPAEPTQAELERYLRDNAARYAQPPRTRFRHLYFSPDRGGPEAARRRAEIALAALAAGGDAGSAGSDPFPDQPAYVGLGPLEARRVFGATPMADAVLNAPPGRWSGPVRSGYGWHLIFPQTRTPGAAGDMDALRETLRSDWLRDAQASANAREMARLKSRYSIVRRESGPP